jgi:hypothetical protein
MVQPSFHDSRRRWVWMHQARLRIRNVHHFDAWKKNTRERPGWRIVSSSRFGHFFGQGSLDVRRTRLSTRKGKYKILFHD